MIREPQTYSQL